MPGGGAAAGAGGSAAAWTLGGVAPRGEGGVTVGAPPQEAVARIRRRGMRFDMVVLEMRYKRRATGATGNAGWTTTGVGVGTPGGRRPPTRAGTSAVLIDEDRVSVGVHRDETGGARRALIGLVYELHS